MPLARTQSAKRNPSGMQTVSAAASQAPQREVERLMKAAADIRHGHRDATMILLAFRHGLAVAI